MMGQSQTLTVSSASADLRAEIARDLLFVLGFVFLGYGLWLYEPWVSFSVVGALMIVVAIVAAIFKGGSAGELVPGGYPGNGYGVNDAK